jgi:hypothetical protein
MRLAIALSAAIFASWISPPLAAADLTKVDRTIRKEPTYRAKPRYGLLVLGPNAETRVWLVIDAKTLYVDRNGDGDLTGADERVVAVDTASSDVLEWRAGGFVEADGKTRHSDLVVYQYPHTQLGRLVESVNVMDVRGASAQGTHGEEGCSFADSPKDAPVIHVNGPLTLRVHSAVVEDAGGSKLKTAPFRLAAGERVAELHVQVGTAGLGRGTFAALAVERGFPAGLSPTAGVTMPGKADPRMTAEAEYPLAKRC